MYSYLRRKVVDFGPLRAGGGPGSPKKKQKKKKMVFVCVTQIY